MACSRRPSNQSSNALAKPSLSCFPSIRLTFSRPTTNTRSSFFVYYRLHYQWWIYRRTWTRHFSRSRSHWPPFWSCLVTCATNRLFCWRRAAQCRSNPTLPRWNRAAVKVSLTGNRRPCFIRSSKCSPMCLLRLASGAADSSNSSRPTRSPRSSTQCFISCGRSRW